MAARRKKTNTGGTPGRNAVVRWTARVFFWGLLTLAAGAVVYGAYAGTRYLFFSGNPHFTLKNLEVTSNGDLQTEDVAEFLADSGVVRDQTNLFAFDPGQLRQALLHHQRGTVNNIRIVRRLPGTLKVSIEERQPIAQLVKKRGKLIDDEGWILPPRYDAYSMQLPIITGIRNPAELNTPMLTSDPMISAAIQLLKHCALKNDFGWMEVAVIQLDYPSEALRIYPAQGGTFTQRARFIIPAGDIEGGMQRVRTIVRERMRARQKTTFIDATYKRNVPVR